VRTGQHIDPEDGLEHVFELRTKRAEEMVASVVSSGSDSSLARRGVAHKHPGGAEVEASAMFADVRGSTGLAEQLPPGEFGQLLTRFWGSAARV
jgi:class 3 adenylate cyclase